MTLVDTSVWIDHFRRSDRHLVELLEEGAVLIHPLIIEELACGNLSGRAEILGLLETLPQAPWAEHSELLRFVASNGVAGSGVGAVDAHLLASARLAGATLWSRDLRLRKAASRLRLLH